LTSVEADAIEPVAFVYEYFRPNWNFGTKGTRAILPFDSERWRVIVHALCYQYRNMPNSAALLDKILGKGIPRKASKMAVMQLWRLPIVTEANLQLCWSMIYIGAHFNQFE
jgi:hypothetical protein